MNTIKDFLTELKDRLTNPLFGSFVISWLICNWPITVALLFYKSADLKADKYKSFFDLIDSRQSTCNMIIYPLIGALLYTFAFPYAKAAIKLFHAKITTDNETEILLATKDGSMPMAKFLRLKNQSDTQLENLKKLIESEGETLNRNAELQTELLLFKDSNQKHESDAHKFKAELSILKYRSQIDAIMGTWLGKGQKDKEGSENVEWIISEKTISDTGNNVSYEISNCIINPFKRELFLRVESKDWNGKLTVRVFIFSVNDSFNILTLIYGGLYSKLILNRSVKEEEN